MSTQSLADRDTADHDLLIKLDTKFSALCEEVAELKTKLDGMERRMWAIMLVSGIGGGVAGGVTGAGGAGDEILKKAAGAIIHVAQILV